ncbi:hypothetical protein IWQ60_011405 [Tieghemiomyces parasiticus]|uniref:Uncharacterized protein n=1 Tax=Tieghemiomyces parasiticus TaxID=78921 RepID=A0A9W7ZS12_9FUNG|nr:hypothetical protein IWQ60_011405 [Tieghemiomyces parasiticus]
MVTGVASGLDVFGAVGLVTGLAAAAPLTSPTTFTMVHNGGGALVSVDGTGTLVSMASDAMDGALVAVTDLPAVGGTTRVLPNLTLTAMPSAPNATLMHIIRTAVALVTYRVTLRLVTVTLALSTISMLFNNANLLVMLLYALVAAMFFDPRKASMTMSLTAVYRAVGLVAGTMAIGQVPLFFMVVIMLAMALDLMLEHGGTLGASAGVTVVVISRQVTRLRAGGFIASAVAVLDLLGVCAIAAITTMAVCAKFLTMRGTVVLRIVDVTLVAVAWAALGGQLTVVRDGVGGIGTNSQRVADRDSQGTDGHDRSESGGESDADLHGE